MDELKKKSAVDSDKEIVFSKSIKAGKRIYYLDVKKNRKDEMFLAITESKKVVSGDGDESQVSFEKHKIFLYQEDFEKFMSGLLEAVSFIKEEQAPGRTREPNDRTFASEEGESALPTEDEIKIDIDF